jgi:hypothetical protein
MWNARRLHSLQSYQHLRDQQPEEERNLGTNDVIYDAVPGNLIDKEE